YIQAKKRDKPGVASIIVEAIRRKGGRFLRRQSSRLDPSIVAWIDIGDARAREKTCQALREGAPEIRKKRSASSVEKVDAQKSPVERDFFVPSTYHSHRHPDVQKRARFPVASERKWNSFSDDAGSTQLMNDNGKDVPIMIRPSFKLTKQAFAEAISVDQLEPHDRVLYLRDFLPPDPAMQ
ncbi:MAG: hypothetical protein SGBAC_012090, partial [Bacillariaceae sp.]